MRHKTAEACEVDGAVSDFWDGLGLGHSKIDHELAHRMFGKVKNAPRDWKPPCSTTLGTTILDAQHQVSVDERSTNLKRKGVEKFGTAAQTGGATIQKHPLLNCMLVCAVWSSALFLKCADCTAHLATGGGDDAEYCAAQMIAAIRSLPYPRYVDLIVTDGAGDMKKFRHLMMAVFPWLYTIWCASKNKGKIYERNQKQENAFTTIVN